MIELSILGFLAQEPLHAYELRRRITALTGHVRQLSDGALNPALRRIADRGWISASDEPGSRGPARRVYTLTPDGRAELTRRLAEPEDLDITDRARYFTTLAFLHELDDPARARSVLERRLAFLETPSRSFFVAEQQQPEGTAALFRRGMTTMARDISRSERAWLIATIVELGGAVDGPDEPSQPRAGSEPDASGEPGKRRAHSPSAPPA